MRGNAITFVLLLVVLTAGASWSFEFKPVGPTGAVGRYLNRWELLYVPAAQAPDCKGRPVDYHGAARGGGSQPVHEYITRAAYYKARNVRLGPEGWESPLLSGVLWNDDPEVLVRKFAEAKFGEFAHAMDLCERDPLHPRMTVRSHCGDLQFLHAMRCSAETPGDASRRASAG